MRVHNLSITVNPPSRAGNPGDVVVFNFTVTNHGNWQDVVMLGLKKQDGLTFDLERDSITLDPGASGTVRLNCRLVTGAMAGTRAFNITATSSDNSSVNSSAILKVTVNPVWDADVSMKEDTKSCDAGKAVSFQMTVVNRGNLPDVYTLSKSSGTMGVTFDRAQMTLGPGETGTVNLTVSVPGDEGGGMRSVKISVRSQGKPGEVALNVVNVDVNAKSTVTPAMIAIPLVVVIAVCVAVAAAGVMHVRSVKRAAADRKRAQASLRQSSPAPTAPAAVPAPQQQKPPEQKPLEQKIPEQIAPPPPPAPGHVEEVIEVTVVEESPPAGK
jgi:uncharacterized membrane protein